MTNFDPGEVIPVIPGSGWRQPLQLGPNLTIPKGTLLGHAGAAANHVHTLTVTNTVSGGTWSMVVNNPLRDVDETLSGLAYNITKASLQLLFDGVFGTKNGVSNALIAGTELATGPLTFTYQGDLAGMPVKLPTIVNTALTGGGSYGIAATTVGQSANTYVPYATLKLANPATAVSPSGTGSGGGFAAGSYTIRATYQTATGETAPTRLEEIEDIMRHSIFHSTLDWQTKEELSDAAQLAVEVLNVLASEGEQQ